MSKATISKAIQIFFEFLSKEDVEMLIAMLELGPADQVRKGVCSQFSTAEAPVTASPLIYLVSWELKKLTLRFLGGGGVGALTYPGVWLMPLTGSFS